MPYEHIKEINFSPAENLNLNQFEVLTIKVWIEEGLNVGPYRVFIRTNLNQSKRIINQIIDRVENGIKYHGDFYEIELSHDSSEQCYKLYILLSEVGYFEFKPRIVSADPNNFWEVWPEGPNVGISVAPFGFGYDNGLYCSFIRQYTSSMSRENLKEDFPKELVEQLESQGFVVIPPSGTFQNFKKVLPFIIKELGMRIIHLLPINPVPVTYGRVGRFGSPYAGTDLFGIEPAYVTFNPYRTMEDEFVNLCSTIHHLGGKVFLDIAINHIGWAARINHLHPEWIKRDPSGKIVSPLVWGILWEDVVKLDYSKKDLWKYMASVFLTWCERGIDGFRLDAGYMIPFEVWEYIIAKVRQRFPNTLFFLEGLGGPLETTELLLSKGGMNWAYSELFQNYKREDIEGYLKYSHNVSKKYGVLVNYAETHDNERLATKGRDYTLMRVMLSALSAPSAAWGITNGVEWLAKERLNMHENSALRWGAKDNITKEIAKLNSILKSYPAFWGKGNIHFYEHPERDILIFKRWSKNPQNEIWIIINLSGGDSTTLSLKDIILELSEKEDIFDLWSNKNINISSSLSVPPYGVFILTEDREPPLLPSWAIKKEEEVYLFYKILLSRFSPIKEDWLKLSKTITNVNDYKKLIVWVNKFNPKNQDISNISLQDFSQDEVDRYIKDWTFEYKNRALLLTKRQWLLVRLMAPYTLYIKQANRLTQFTEPIFVSTEGEYHTYLSPFDARDRFLITFLWKVVSGDFITRKWEGKEFLIVRLPEEDIWIENHSLKALSISKEEIIDADNEQEALITNEKGSYSLVAVKPLEIYSKYSALLAVTPDPERAGERYIVAKGIKETLTLERGIFTMDEGFLVKFKRYPYPTWYYKIDLEGVYLELTKSILIDPDKDDLYVRYSLKESKEEVTIEIDPILETRYFHDASRPELYEEEKWVSRVELLKGKQGFVFYHNQMPSLKVTTNKGSFILAPYCTDNICHFVDEQRGQEAKGAGFTPGRFRVKLREGEEFYLSFTTSKKPRSWALIESLTREKQARLTKTLIYEIDKDKEDNFLRLLLLALDQFIVKKGDHWTILAGYPWFQDWGRDSLICIGGLVEAGRIEEAKDILFYIASHEKAGTLPNLFWGGEALNRDTVDAPLWLFMATEHLIKKEGASILESILPDGRNLWQVLTSIFEHYKNGTENGIFMDKETGFIYSPPHFTWMDTNHPACTPREGFPVEIQALWFNALSFMMKYSTKENVHEEYSILRDKVKASFLKHFWYEDGGYLYDIIIRKEENFVGDDAIRPNQLFAIIAGLIEEDYAKRVVNKIEKELLIPGGLRSLADKPVKFPLYIRDRNGDIIGDPYHPYRGKYEGDEDLSRKPAYHNGTVWMWLYPVFIEARFQISDKRKEDIEEALSYFKISLDLMKERCIGSLPEIADGDYPHHPRGCLAQAWSVAENLRVYVGLKRELKKVD